MMQTLNYDPLLSCLLEILRATKDMEYPLVLVGGYGLHLKQIHTKTKENCLLKNLPTSRSTRDLDVMLDLNIVMNRIFCIQVRDILRSLGFEAVEQNQFWQWRKSMELAGSHFDVLIDVLTGPINGHHEWLHLDSKEDPRRVRPKGKSISFHARTTREALEFNVGTSDVSVSGRLLDGNEYETQVKVASPFSYLLMKIAAFCDQCNNRTKQNGSHHVLDLYRIVGLLTEQEYKYTQTRVQDLQATEVVQEAINIVREFFVDPMGLGMIRLKEHPLCSEDLQTDEFREALCEIFQISLQKIV